jgi:hypothetical protein
LLGSIDNDLSRLHKEIQTQHQWRFEAVKEGIYFPFGCKTTFKAYSSNKVVEFEKLPRGQCCTPIGQYTGLEPSTTYNTWQPEPEGVNSLPGRPVEGFYLLINLPSSEVVSPKPFSEGTAAKILDTLEEVKKRWPSASDPKIAEEWKEWGKVFAPRSDSAEEYVQQLRRNGEPFHIPLRDLIFDSNNSVLRNWTLNERSSKVDPDFVYPEILKAAMNSVRSRFNPDPLMPRLSSSTDTELTENLRLYKDNLKEYELYLSSLNAGSLKERSRRHVLYNGISPSVNGIFIIVTDFFTI